MQKSKLGLDFEKIGYAKQISKDIAENVQKFVDNYTTVAVERTLCRLLGVDGVDENEVPLPNIVVDELKDQGVLSQGAMFYLGNAIIETGKTPQQIAEMISKGELEITKLPIHPMEDVKNALQP
ncbi:MAG: D-lysine 5,6-aminomutase subunit alpha, partial [Bacteroidales bacterium]|nr:D-lysine 5,6-aminomutase subunit alpha [Bacteroidales bacterium]